MSALVDIETTADTSALDDYLTRLAAFQANAGGATSAASGFTDVISNSARVGDIAVLSVDRMQISQDLVTNASIRQELAQTRLTDAVDKYGAGSQQAVAAQQQLTIATDNVTVAHTRQEERLISMALVTIPRLITGVKSLIESFEVQQGENQATTASFLEVATAADVAKIAIAATGIGIPLILAGLALSQGFGNAGATSTNIYGNVNNYSTGTGAGTSQSTAALMARSGTQ